LRLAVHGDDDRVDDRRPEPGVFEVEGRTSWGDEGRDLDVRPDFSAIVGALEKLGTEEVGARILT
jgi:hypothetical protein